MEQTIPSKPNIRALIFYFMLISVILLILSGTILDNMNLSDAMRHVLIGLHKVGASVLVIAAGDHVYHHRKSIAKYMTRQGSAFQYTKELAIVFVIMVVILMLSGIYVLNKYL